MNRAFALALALLLATPSFAEEVGQIATDWTGNDIIVDAIQDPKIQGITCHLTYFERGLIDRLRKGNWFQDPSNSSIACRQTGPITVGDIETGKKGEEVFREGLSLVFKSLVVRRIFDKANNTLVYVAHSRRIQEGSAKMSVSTVPLYNAQVTWANAR
jgi:CreA protein